jgi:hypothetical protein
MVGNARSAITDSLGRYALRGVPVGVVQIRVTAANFPAHTFIVELSIGQIVERPVLMDSTSAVAQLPGVGVTARAPVANYRLVAFERRRQNGRGQYLTEDEIVRSGAFNVADAIKGMRGVTYECGGGAGCFVRMTRAPMQCLPEYIVDDQVLNDFGPSTAIRDIVGLEVYTGPSDVPGEYAGRNSGCGVIVIWTRSGPSKRPS